MQSREWVGGWWVVRVVGRREVGETVELCHPYPGAKVKKHWIPYKGIERNDATTSVDLLQRFRSVLGSHHQ